MLISLRISTVVLIFLGINSTSAHSMQDENLVEKPSIQLEELPKERIRLRSWIIEGRAIAALPDLNSYLALFPENGALYLLKGEALYSLERFEESAIAFSRGVELDPGKLGELFNYGRCLQSLDRYKEALEVFLSMQSRSDKSLQVRGYFGEGLSRQSLGNIEEAKRLYQKALTLNPSFDRARYRLALILLDDSPDEALSMLNRVLISDPLHHGGAYNKALALRNLQRMDDAQKALARYQQILAGRSRIALLKERWAMTPHETSILLELGRVYRSLGVTGESLRWFARAGGLAPNDPEPAIETLRTLILAQRRAEALQLVQRLKSTTLYAAAKDQIEDLLKPPAEEE
jgi:tetratricopeptide (TPR) repeat protein